MYSYNNSQAPVDNRGDTGQLEAPTTKPPDPNPRLVVDVYYECLCPDSRYFVLHQLLPAFQKVGSLMTIHMWPYGKATTEKTDTGEGGRSGLY